MEYRLYERIKEAFETSTMSYNRFAKVIRSIKWDNQFQADGEYYFTLGRLIFTTPSLDPFQIGRSWRPEVTFSSGDMLEI